MSIDDPDETLTVVNKLRLQLQLYRKAHGGRSPLRIEVHPALYRLIVNAADASEPGVTEPRFQGIPIRMGSGAESPFVLVDP